MKKHVILFLVSVFFTVFNMNAVKLKGSKYEGAARAKGNAYDYWVTMEMDAEDAEFNVANILNFMGEYTDTQSGKNVTISIKIPGKPNAVLKSTDGGESFSGQMKTDLGDLELWLLKVAKKHKPTEMPNEELTNILNSEDGYTCFMIVNVNGKLGSMTGELKFYKDGRFRLLCDNQTMQEILKNFKGSYKVENGVVILDTERGVVMKAPVYDEGIYIDVPVNLSASGITIESLKLIR